MKHLILTASLCLTILAFSAPVFSQKKNLHTQVGDLLLEQIAEGFSIPWAMAFISDEQLIITEREGRIQLLNIKTNKRQLIKNTPEVVVDGQGGMLDVKLSPDYTSTGWIYFTYVKDQDDEGVTVLARAKLQGDSFRHWQELLVSKSATATGYHFGSRIAFDEKRHVYFTIGDRGERASAQDLTTHAGSVLRLNLDGSVPADNPFIKNKNALPEIWSYGHRNPQGLSYDYINKRLWLIEHGPRGGDEINLVEAGKNYGWPIISYGKEYWGPISVGEGTHKEGMLQPVKTYIPSIAPGSLLFYSSDAIPDWKGNLFSGALKLRHINRVVLDKNAVAVQEERLLESLAERIRALSQSPEGWLYFSTDSGKVFRIRPR